MSTGVWRPPSVRTAKTATWQLSICPAARTIAGHANRTIPLLGKLLSSMINALFGVPPAGVGIAANLLDHRSCRQASC